VGLKDSPTGNLAITTGTALALAGLQPHEILRRRRRLPGDVLAASEKVFLPAMTSACPAPAGLPSRNAGASRSLGEAGGRRASPAVDVRLRIDGQSLDVSELEDGFTAEDTGGPGDLLESQEEQCGAGVFWIVWERLRCLGLRGRECTLTPTLSLLQKSSREREIPTSRTST
jgi:hypothetical protein